MVLSLNDVIDQTFGNFRKFQNAADFGSREIGLDNGVFPVGIDSIFIPTLSGNEGYLISRIVPLHQGKPGQPERSIAYTNVSALENIKGTEGVTRLFKIHLIPPGGEKVGIVKVYGTLIHYVYQGMPEEITRGQVQTPRYNIDVPLNAIVVSGLNLDPRFSTLRVLQEAAYNPQAPMHCFGMVLNDLKLMPKYAVSG